MGTQRLVEWRKIMTHQGGSLRSQKHRCSISKTHGHDLYELMGRNMKVYKNDMVAE